MREHSTRAGLWCLGASLRGPASSLFLRRRRWRVVEYPRDVLQDPRAVERQRARGAVRAGGGSGSASAGVRVVRCLGARRFWGARRLSAQWGKTARGPTHALVLRPQAPAAAAKPNGNGQARAPVGRPYQGPKEPPRRGIAAAPSLKRARLDGSAGGSIAAGGEDGPEDAAMEALREAGKVWRRRARGEALPEPPLRRPVGGRALEAMLVDCCAARRHKAAASHRRAAARGEAHTHGQGAVCGGGGSRSIA